MEVEDETSDPDVKREFAEVDGKKITFTVNQKSKTIQINAGKPRTIDPRKKIGRRNLRKFYPNAQEPFWESLPSRGASVGF